MRARTLGVEWVGRALDVGKSHSQAQTQNRGHPGFWVHGCPTQNSPQTPFQNRHLSRRCNQEMAKMWSPKLDPRSHLKSDSELSETPLTATHPSRRALKIRLPEDPLPIPPPISPFFGPILATLYAPFAITGPSDQLWTESKNPRNQRALNDTSLILHGDVAASGTDKIVKRQYPNAFESSFPPRPQ